MLCSIKYKTQTLQENLLLCGSYRNKAVFHCGPKSLVKSCCGEDMKQTEAPELGGYPRQTGGDTREGAEVGSDPDPAEIHVTQEPIGLNQHTTSE